MAGSAGLVSPGWLLEGRYRLDDRIAVGGMGEVWRATDLVLERPVAVKLLQPGYTEHKENLVRFRAEARHMSSLSHPGIAQIYDYREADPPYPPFLVMELVNGPSLARLLDQGPLGPARTMGLIAQAAMALQAAHAAGLVHRDIKPGNLLVSQDKQVKITDFGIASVAGSTSMTRPGMLIGTAAYLAPERIMGEPATPATDLYALGIVAYQCLTGRLPFEGKPLAVALAHQEKPLPPLPPWVPAEVAALVADLTAKDPRARPASAWEVATRAEQWRAALAATTHQRGKPNRRILAGLPARAALASVVIAAIGAAAWAMAGMHGQTAAHLHSGRPSATQRQTHRGSHQASSVVPAHKTGNASATHAPGPDSQSTAARSAPAPSEMRTPSGTPTPSGTQPVERPPTRGAPPEPWLELKRYSTGAC
jgi:serine/threonine protein kinase